MFFQSILTKQFRKDVPNYLVSLAVICYLRLSINNFQSPKFSKNDNPIAHDSSILTRTLTFLYLPIFHANLIAFPKTLSFDWSMDAIPRVESILDSRFVLSFICYSALFKIIGKLIMDFKNSHQNQVLLFLIALLTTPHILSSNLLTYVGFVAAERILYLNTVAYCILIGFGVEVARKK